MLTKMQNKSWWIHNSQICTFTNVYTDRQFLGGTEHKILLQKHDHFVGGFEDTQWYIRKMSSHADNWIWHD